jgi:hypothetical protein
MNFNAIPWKKIKVVDLRIGDWFTADNYAPVFAVRARLELPSGHVCLRCECVGRTDHTPTWVVGDFYEYEYAPSEETTWWDPTPVSEEETELAKRRLEELT